MVDTLHIGKIHSTKLIDGYIQCFHRRLHPLNGYLCLDGLLIKHVCLFHISIFINFLQRAKKRIITVIPECPAVPL